MAGSVGPNQLGFCRHLYYSLPRLQLMRNEGRAYQKNLEGKRKALDGEKYIFD
jgi:hypothetical protein